GETRVLMCEDTSSRSGCCARNWLSCSSKAVAGDLPEGSLWRTTSNVFAFISDFLCHPAPCRLTFHQSQHPREHLNRPCFRPVQFLPFSRRQFSHSSRCPGDWRFFVGRRDRPATLLRP